jgi:hypothetical protein
VVTAPPGGHPSRPPLLDTLSRYRRIVWIVPTTEEIRQFLVAEGYTVREKRDLVEGGSQLLTDQGPIVNILDTGIVRVEGRNKTDLEAKLSRTRSTD